MSNLYLLCSVCGTEIDWRNMNRHALVTLEKFTESGMKCYRWYLCSEHEREFINWIEPISDDELIKTGGICGND